MKSLSRVGLLCLCLWFTFPVLAQTENTTSRPSPWKFSGGLQLGTQFYRVYGITPRVVSPAWNIYGNAAINFKNVISVPFSFTLGQQGNSATYPSFRQLGVSPKMGALTLHAGWRRMRFSDYTLSDHTFAGAGFEFNPGKLRLAAMTGRLRKAATARTLAGENYGAQFKRTATAFKLGYGTENSYIDLIFMKAKDDAGSLPQSQIDSTLTAAENALSGINMRMAASSNFSWYGEFVVSAFTRNVESSIIDQGSGLSSFFGKVLQPRLSTKTNYALKTGVDMGSQALRCKLQYERIMPEFETMGAFFFMNDMENISILPNLSLFDYKLRINGQLGIQRNNLLNTRSETTKRLLGNGNISFQANERFGIDFTFNSININQEQARIRFADSIRIAMVTRSYMLGPRWMWLKDSTLIKTLTTSVNYQELNDRNPYTRLYTNMKTWFALAQYSYSMPLRKTTLSAGINYNIIDLPDLRTSRMGVSVSYDKSNKANSLTVSSSLSYNLSFLESGLDGSLVSGNLTASIIPLKRHTLQAGFNMLINHSSQYDSYTEIIAQLTYGYQFQ